MEMAGRGFSGSYRFGYQGSEKDNEVSGEGNSYTTEFRQLDPRLGRWFSVDPVFQPWQSPYTSMDNDPINLIDILGMSTKNADGTGSASAGEGAWHVWKEQSQGISWDKFCEINGVDKVTGKKDGKVLTTSTKFKIVPKPSQVKAKVEEAPKPPITPPPAGQPYKGGLDYYNLTTDDKGNAVLTKYKHDNGWLVPDVISVYYKPLNVHFTFTKYGGYGYTPGHGQGNNVNDWELFRNDPLGAIYSGKVVPEEDIKGNIVKDMVVALILKRALKSSGTQIKVTTKNGVKIKVAHYSVTFKGVTSARMRVGTNGKSIVIGRDMKNRVNPFAKEIGAETWTGFDTKLTEAQNLANNKAWIQEKINQGYSVYDVGTGPESSNKGVYYDMETKEAFGD